MKLDALLGKSQIGERRYNAEAHLLDNANELGLTCSANEDGSIHVHTNVPHDADDVPNLLADLVETADQMGLLYVDEKGLLMIKTELGPKNRDGQYTDLSNRPRVRS